MVINSTNIYKMKQSHLILPELNEHEKVRPQHMMLEILVLAWDRHKNVAGLNRLIFILFNI